MSQRYTWAERDIAKGSREHIIGLLEDMHILFDGYPPRQCGPNYFENGPHIGKVFDQMNRKPLWGHKDTPSEEDDNIFELDSDTDKENDHSKINLKKPIPKIEPKRKPFKIEQKEKSYKIEPKAKAKKEAKSKSMIKDYLSEARDRYSKGVKIHSNGGKDLTVVSSDHKSSNLRMNTTQELENGLGTERLNRKHEQIPSLINNQKGQDVCSPFAKFQDRHSRFELLPKTKVVDRLPEGDSEDSRQEIQMS